MHPVMRNSCAGAFTTGARFEVPQLWSVPPASVRGTSPDAVVATTKSALLLSVS